MASAAGKRTQPTLDIDGAFEQLVKGLLTANQDKDAEAMRSAMESLGAAIAKFDKELKEGVAASNLMYGRALPVWLEKREKLGDVYEGALQSFQRLFPDLKPPKPLKFRKFSSGKSREGSVRAQKPATVTQQDDEAQQQGAVDEEAVLEVQETDGGSQQKEVALVDDQGQQVVAVEDEKAPQENQQGDEGGKSPEKGQQPANNAPNKSPAPSRRSSRLAATRSVYTSRTGGLTVPLMNLNDENLTKIKVQQLITMQSNELKRTLAKASKDPKQRALERLYEAYAQVKGSIVRLKQWTLEFMIGKDFAELDALLEAHTALMDEAEDCLEEHNWDFSVLEEALSVRSQDVASWVEAHATEGQAEGSKGVQAKQSVSVKNSADAKRVRESSPPSSDSDEDEDDNWQAQAGKPLRRNQGAQPERRQNRRRADSIDSDDVLRRYQAMMNQNAKGQADTNKPAQNSAPASSTVNIDALAALAALAASQPLQLQVNVPPISVQGSSTAGEPGLAQWFRAQQLEKAIPTFGGKLEDFHTWYNAAEQYVDDAPGVPEGTRLQVLKDRLTGDAAVLAKNITPSSDKPLDSLLAVLKAEYGNKTIATKFHRKRLLTLKRPARLNYAGWRDFLLVIKDVRDVCKAGGKSIKTDEAVVTHLLDTVPVPWRKDFLKKYPLDADCHLDNLILFLEGQVALERRQEVWSAKHGDDKEESKSKDLKDKDKGEKFGGKTRNMALATNVQQTEQGEGSCLACRTEDHALVDCQVFRDMPYGRRWSLVRRASPPFHYRCLVQHPLAGECTLPQQQCSISRDCPFDHHELIHPPPREQNQRQQQEPRNNRGGRRDYQPRGRPRQRQGNQRGV